MDNSTQINKSNGIYLDLDSILDTRLSLLFNIDNELAKEAIVNGYKHRDEDLFPGVPKDRFVELYSKRNKEVLINATITKLINLINEFLIEIIKNTIVTPVNTNPIIYLNLYPYSLSEDEKKSVVLGITAATHGLATVNTLYIDNKLLTPSFLKEKVGLAFMYEYHKWIQENVETLKKDPSPGLGLVGPALYFGDKPNDVELAKIIKEYGGVFKATEDMSAPLIGLQLIPVEFFCMKH